MKKVSVWIRKVLAFCSNFPCADTREELLRELESGSFDLEHFEELCRNSYIAYHENGVMDYSGGNGYGAFDNPCEAIEAVGKNGTVKNMQNVLHEIFNN